MTVGSLGEIDPSNESMMTPYGLPSPFAYTFVIPNDCVGILIGRGGEAIRNL